MECTNSNDDCYFYYYSSCTKGDDCPYRHCVAALGTETVCTAWREGRCYRNNCKFRHMESRINRSSIPCYWENQPGGCRKPHCVFLHRKDRVIISSLSEEQKLILPVSSQPHSPNSVDVVLESSKSDAVEVHSLSPPQLIEPLVVSLDEGEESDSESTASTPMKTSTLEISNSKFSKRLFTTSKPSDFGIKTLEQIRMERIHRESEHFYNTDKIDGNDLGENSELTRLDKLHNESNSYYPTDPGMHNALSNEVTQESREAELYQNASLYPLEMNNILHDNNETDLSQEEKAFVDNCLPGDDLSGDLRNKLKKIRRAELQASPIKDMPKKRVISLKKTTSAVDGESPAVTVTFEKMIKEQGSDASSVDKKEPKAKGALNFRIKTLDEIRKEKEKKNDHMEHVLCPEYSSETFEQNFINWEENQCDSVDESQNSFSNGLRVSTPKRKLKRMPIEVYKIPQKLSKNEPNKDHKIMTSIKRSLPEEPIPTKYMKICESSVIVKSDCHQVDSVTESILDEECSKETNAVEEKSSSSKRLLLQRNNLTFLKNDCSSNDCLELKSSNMNEIPDEHAESSNDLKCQISTNKNRSIPQNSSFDRNKSHPLSAQGEGTVVGNSDVDLYTLPSPVMATKPEGRSLILSSTEDIDKLFSVCDTDLSLEVDCSTDKNSDDIFLELEKMIQS